MTSMELEEEKTSSSLPSMKRMKEYVEKQNMCPSYQQGHLPKYEDVKRYRTLSKPHVESFNHFLEHGLPNGVQDIAKNKWMEMDLLPSSTSLEGAVPESIDVLKMWFENVSVAKPTRSEPTRSPWNGGKATSALTPRECRERGLTYGGHLMADLCYQINTRKRISPAEGGQEFSSIRDYQWVEYPGRIVRVSKRFGEIPIMLMSKACHLRNKKPQELVQMKEEVRSTIYKYILYIIDFNTVRILFLFVFKIYYSKLILSIFLKLNNFIFLTWKNYFTTMLRL